MPQGVSHTPSSRDQGLAQMTGRGHSSARKSSCSSLVSSGDSAGGWVTSKMAQHEASGGLVLALHWDLSPGDAGTVGGAFCGSPGRDTLGESHLSGWLGAPVSYATPPTPLRGPGRWVPGGCSHRLSQQQLIRELVRRCGARAPAAAPRNPRREGR